MGAGPILIFDKSALQAFSADESVMLDQFFLTNITPIFFIESLGDLEKPDRRGRTPEQAVMKDLAAKVPDNPRPNIFHETLVAQDLLGNPVAMTGQIPLAGGVARPDGQGGVSVMFHESPEGEMVRRWQAGEFAEAERRFAGTWRSAILQVNFRKKIDLARRVLIKGRSVTDLPSVKTAVDQFLKRSDGEAVVFAATFLGVSDEYAAVVEQRHASSGRPPIHEFAPYAAFVLGVDLVFYLAMATDVITSQKKTNLIDLSYLYYLPFCMVFTSRDKLHAQLAPMFLRPRQRFVWADELKAGLKTLNEYYAPSRAKMGRIGLMREREPPKEVPTIVSELWESCLRLDGIERDSESASRVERRSEPPSMERINQIIESSESATLAPGRQPDSVILQGHLSSRRRGDWDLNPQDCEEEG